MYKVEVPPGSPGSQPGGTAPAEVPLQHKAHSLLVGGEGGEQLRHGVHLAPVLEIGAHRVVEGLEVLLQRRHRRRRLLPGGGAVGAGGRHGGGGEGGKRCQPGSGRP